MHELLLSVTNDVKQLMRAQAVNANNLANASTDGFKAEIAFMVTSQRMGSLSSVPDLSSGSIKSTGRDLDVAVNGDDSIDEPEFFSPSAGGRYDLRRPR